ncbi:MAG: four-carbon acid sugar kinase family protein [Bacteroidota bacterium]
MKKELNHIPEALPPVDIYDYRTENNRLFQDLNITCVVVDDDPTGNQTVYDVPLLTRWTEDVLASELMNQTPVFFILTNSRSLTADRSKAVYEEVGRNVQRASEKTGRKYLLISRSDSTLRGHFPIELEALCRQSSQRDFVRFVIPVMFEGGRVTLDDVHYVKDGTKLTPVGDTPFAKDATFGYTASALPMWIEEKTGGEVKASDVVSFSLEEIRTGTVEQLVDKVLEIPSSSTAICNALQYEDLDKMTQALLTATTRGKKLIYRTSSSFVPSYIGLPPRPLLQASDLTLQEGFGGLIVVGSYVPKSGQQLAYLLDHIDQEAAVELNVDEILTGGQMFDPSAISKRIDALLAKHPEVVLYTSRKLVTGGSAEKNLLIGNTVSNTLVDIVKQLENRPRYLISKGGITSHDLATRSLGMSRGQVLGQLLPGVPVWKITSETRSGATRSGTTPFSDFPYLVFPGNVGDESSLFQLTQKLK